MQKKNPDRRALQDIEAIGPGFCPRMNLSPTTATYGYWNSNSDPNPNSENDHVTQSPPYSRNCGYDRRCGHSCLQRGRCPRVRRWRWVRWRRPFGGGGFSRGGGFGGSHFAGTHFGGNHFAGRGIGRGHPGRAAVTQSAGPTSITAGSAATVAGSSTATTADTMPRLRLQRAPGPCTCLTKTYTQDGLVVFADVCTKEAASAPVDGADVTPPAKSSEATPPAPPANVADASQAPTTNNYAGRRSRISWRPTLRHRRTKDAVKCTAPDSD